MEGSETNHQVVIVYRKRPNAPRELRVITPEELKTTRQGDQILVAYDHDRQATRSFRVDRIEDMVHSHPLIEVTS